ncbi:MAG: DUF1816 domain-containing protein [Leptolyngbyaceae cyanobacterium]|nr:DUF1816 domain-containing protein [Leptodesmis sichuanensis]UIE38160.1 DUF1816 domain-containing protein [Leptodesmis sichuanensis A121]
MQELFTRLIDLVGLAWWVEVKTESPRCIYYFGPFLTADEAEAAKPGYVEDLQQEDAQGIEAVTKRCKPVQLTIYDDDLGELPSKVTPSFSSPLT